MRDNGSRHQHGVKKKLFDVIGGAVVGSAAVLLLRGLFGRSGGQGAKPRADPQPADAPSIPTAPLGTP
jgi:hypothetical protein